MRKQGVVHVGKERNGLFTDLSRGSLQIVITNMLLEEAWKEQGILFFILSEIKPIV